MPRKHKLDRKQNEYITILKEKGCSVEYRGNKYYIKLPDSDTLMTFHPGERAYHPLRRLTKKCLY